MTNNTVKVKCCYCDRSTNYSKDAISEEVKRLKIYNYEILTCQYCQHKFSKSDFEIALNGKASPILKEELSLVTIPILKQPTEDSLLKCYEEQIELEISQEIKSREITKMQSGEKYNKEIVGLVDMENGTPRDRNCVRILKKEAEIYAYTFLALDEIITGIYTILITILHLASDLFEYIISKINWCIACSSLRIAYFIGFIGFSVLSVGSLIFTKSSLITPPPITHVYDIYAHIVWTFITLCISVLPLIIQLIWAFNTPKSRWAKIIKKRADEIIIKE